MRDRRPHDDGIPWLLMATPTLVDPGRAPEGHHTP
jgi:phytoene dehydrogenase-like protein